MRMKDLLKDMFCSVLDACGVYERRLQKDDASVWFIPMYHRVVEDAAVEDPLDMGMCVSETHFAQQLAYINTHFDVATVAEVVDLINADQPLPKRLASITFDDGYLDNLTRAAPALQSLDMRATLFVATDFIGSPTGFWWDDVISAFAHCDADQALSLALSDGTRYSTSVSQGERKQVAQRTLDVLWRQPPAQIAGLVSDIVEQLSPQTTVPSPVMDEDGIRQCQARAFDIAAHTQSHPNLNLIPREQVEQEILNSQRILNTIDGVAVNGFATPAGFTPDYLSEFLAANDFEFGVSVNRGLNRTPDRFLLQRIGMPNSPVARVKRAISAL